MREQDTPHGYCHCGCGRKTRLAPANDPRHDHIKGEPVRFLKGHHARGRIVSDETRRKLSAASRGDVKSDSETSYRRLHARLCERFPKIGVCEECGKERRTVYALIHGRKYSSHREDYRELCHRCHMRYDLGGRPLTADHRAKISAAKRQA